MIVARPWKWECADCLNLLADMFDHLIYDHDRNLCWFRTKGANI